MKTGSRYRSLRDIVTDMREVGFEGAEERRDHIESHSTAYYLAKQASQITFATAYTLGMVYTVKTW